MNVAIVKYNAGNTHSVYLALQRLGIEAITTDEAELLKSADKVIFPGVGEASTAMNYLKERNLDNVLKELKQPVLGICLGMQLMCKHSEEGNTETFGIFNNVVRRFTSSTDKIPHMGWNNISLNPSPLFNDVSNDEYFYFVHSYYAEASNETKAVCQYAGIEFSAALQKDNFYGVQFHPEKSSDQGAKLLKNFIEL